ncbi:hypothetical protein N7462_007760 [Penicillium macrosclerotiorum]|uniref:uncharacterized protein n=1 Tax=Penicillium macrosclerotiorum TaxID=303699 RepID=UPI00254956BC|nr:uncharacterized protein N7462_007760 [Penicillium macrosclerotiorum]KAJ5679516.1 hypothetical protein N7462_007760 [Penicillium macrosclerotiorum]
MSDRAPSTLFATGPPSPSSPTDGSLKENSRPLISSDHIPQTPTSPPLMSVSDQNHVSNFTSSQTSPNQATIQRSTTSSPPSSTPMSTQVSQQPTMSTTNSFPTPASSVSGHANAISVEDSERKSFTTGMQDTVTSTRDAPNHQIIDDRRQEHNQQHSSTRTGIRDFALSRVTAMDAMDVDKEPVSDVDSRNLGLESLQKEFTSAFHLCKSSPIATGPDPSLDLISLYGLGPIAQSVARIHPITGEKINRLRKSYEGKLKGLGLAGRNKPVKQEPGAPGSLRHLIMWPEEEWQNQKVFGKQIKVPDIDSALQNLQGRAMQLEPGTVPNNDFWEDILGHEKPAKTQGPGDSSKKSALPPAGRPTAQAPLAAQGAQEPERARPSRGRKRHYDDNSFVGYGEGYADDDDETGFYSNGEGSGKKKRKKDHVSKVSTPLSERSGSYGVGMFGIGAR